MLRFKVLVPQHTFSNCGIAIQALQQNRQPKNATLGASAHFSSKPSSTRRVPPQRQRLSVRVHSSPGFSSPTCSKAFLLRNPPLPSAENSAMEPTPSSTSRGRKKTKKPAKKSDARRTLARATPSIATEKPQIGKAVPSGGGTFLSGCWPHSARS